ncbi:MAG: bifunctional nuclease family protein [Arachnia sp.]
MISLEVIGIRLLSPEDGPVLLLGEEGGTRSLPIWIGSGEAAAIAAALEDEVPQRPMTHDLLATLAARLGPAGEVFITGMHEGIYDAILRLGGEEFQIRPSDGVALAVRLGWPVRCPRALMDQVGVEVEGGGTDEVEAFRAFLDSVSAEDFEDEGPSQ